MFAELRTGLREATRMEMNTFISRSIYLPCVSYIFNQKN